MEKRQRGGDFPPPSTQEGERVVKRGNRPPFPARFWVWLLEFADDLFQVLVAVVLLVTAVLVFAHLLSLVVQGFAEEGPLLPLVYSLIHDALLILIILELIWTAITYLESHTLPLEPFIVVAIIASVRRLLFLGVQTVEGEIEPTILWDIGLHAAIVFVFSLSLFLVRWSRRFIKPRGEHPPTPSAESRG